MNDCPFVNRPICVIFLTRVLNPDPPPPQLLSFGFLANGHNLPLVLSPFPGHWPIFHMYFIPIIFTISEILVQNVCNICDFFLNVFF